MKSLTALFLILTLGNILESNNSYKDFTGKADLILIAWMEYADLQAEGDKVQWTVTYRIKSRLKGDYLKDKVTLNFDSTQFKHVEKANVGDNQEHKMVILFLSKKLAGDGYNYVGPLLNSPLLSATDDNVRALHAVLAKPETGILDWIKANKTIVVLIGCFVVLLAVLIFVLKRTSNS